VSLNVGGTLNSFDVVGGNHIDVDPHQSDTTVAQAEGSFFREFTNPADLALFLPVQVHVTRVMSGGITFDGPVVPFSGDLLYSFSPTIEYDFVPTPESGALALVTMGIVVVIAVHAGSKIRSALQIW
jgi:hypothetical protein